MATTSAPASTAAPPMTREPTISRRDQLAVAFFGSWMITGLYLDGWAHIHSKPESFFSPWHGVLYSGFGAAIAYFGFRNLRYRGSDVSSRPVDRLMTLGFVMFVAGALSDGLWHSIFGIEAGIEALLSPTHLLLMIGGLLMVSGPIRAASSADSGGNNHLPAPSFREFSPVLVTSTLVVGLVSFFTMFTSAFEPELYHSLGTYAVEGEGPQIWGIVSILFSNLLLIGPAIFVLKKWVPPFGTFTIMFTVTSFGLLAMHGFLGLQTVLSAALGGLTADVISRRVRGFERRIWLVAGVTPLVLWTSWLVILAATYGVAWAPELTVGSVILAVMSGLGLALLGAGGSTGHREATG